jgi:hypothetical protein
MDGLCQCGCGQPAPIAARTVKSRGRIKGQPMKFIRGHNSAGMNRSKPYKADRYREEDRGFTSPCWIWQLKLSARTGYGIVRVAGRDWLAHRWYYEQANGPIEDGLQLDHLCRVRECVNPAHMEPVTPQENTRRSTVAKLSDEQAAMIEMLARSGEFSNAAIGRRFGVTRETVRLIAKNGAGNLRNGPRP